MSDREPTSFEDLLGEDVELDEAPVAEGAPINAGAHGVTDSVEETIEDVADNVITELPEWTEEEDYTPDTEPVQESDAVAEKDEVIDERDERQVAFDKKMAVMAKEREEKRAELQAALDGVPFAKGSPDAEQEQIEEAGQMTWNNLYEDFRWVWRRERQNLSRRGQLHLGRVRARLLHEREHENA